MRLLRIVGGRLAAAEDKVQDFAFRRADQRVARSLLRLADHHGGDALTVSHEDTAKLAGVARETATRLLGAMDANGLIRSGYRSLVIDDREAIE